MGRAGERSRALALIERRRLWRERRRHLLRPALLVGVLAACLIAASAKFVHPAVAGAVFGAFVTALGFAINESLTSRRVRELVDGNLAEQFTSDAVRKLWRRGWRIVNCVEFENCDVDHVVFGPGGVHAVETKWTNHDWSVQDGSFSNDWARKAVRQCRANRNKVFHLLRGNYRIELDVTPLLVIWGEGRPHLAAPVEIDGVVVVDGRLLQDYLRGLPERLSGDSAAAARLAVRDFIRQRHRQATVPRRRVVAFG